MKIKKTFSQQELLDAIVELEKVWLYEGKCYEENFLDQREITKLDAKRISYGVNLGILRKIFQPPTDDQTKK